MSYLTNWSSTANYIIHFQWHIIWLKICLKPYISGRSRTRVNLKHTAYSVLVTFHSLEVVSRYYDTQLQVTENLCDLWNSSLNIYQFQDWKHILWWTASYQGYTGANKKQNVYCSGHQRFNPFKLEFTIVIIIHCKPRIAVAILDLQWMKMTWSGC